MKNLRRAIWGLIFVAAAVVIALNSFNIIDFNIFFEGWWTLFIIVPSFIELITDKDKGGSIFGLCLGIFLLLCARDILDFNIINQPEILNFILILLLHILLPGNHVSNTIAIQMIHENPPHPNSP